MQVDVLALDGVFDTGLAAALDAFGTARELAHDEQPITVRMVGVGEHPRVRTSWGLEVPVEAPPSPTSTWPCTLCGSTALRSPTPWRGTS